MNPGQEGKFQVTSSAWTRHIFPFSNILSNRMKINSVLQMQSWKTMFNESTHDFLKKPYNRCFFKLEKNIFTLHQVGLVLNCYNSKKSDINTWCKTPPFILLLNGNRLAVWISIPMRKPLPLPSVHVFTIPLAHSSNVPGFDGVSGASWVVTLTVKPFEICDAYRKMV